METVIRGAAIYFVVLVLVRISGRRSLSEMTPFDLVLILIIAETTQQALLGDDFSLTNAAILIVTLFVIDIGLSYVKEYWPWADKVLDGKPTLLIADGKQDDRALKRARVSIDDIMSTARSQYGIGQLSEVRHAVLETDGKISIIAKQKA